jgi:hypothetical protein
MIVNAKLISKMHQKLGRKVITLFFGVDSRLLNDGIITRFAAAWLGVRM